MDAAKKATSGVNGNDLKQARETPVKEALAGSYGPTIRELAQTYAKPPTEEGLVKNKPYEFSVTLEGRMAHHLIIGVNRSRDVSNKLDQEGFPSVVGRLCRVEDAIEKMQAKWDAIAERIADRAGKTIDNHAAAYKMTRDSAVERGTAIFRELSSIVSAERERLERSDLIRIIITAALSAAVSACATNVLLHPTMLQRLFS